MIESERIDTVVIGAGQSGLSVGYHLANRDVPFVILDANERVGDAWRHRWDSLRLFTPAHEDGLDGLEFPAPPEYAPTKDEMADYLETYAAHFDLPIRLGTRVDRLSANGGSFMVAAGDRVIEADNVVVAMAGWQRGKVPDFAADLDPRIHQLRSDEYRRPSQVPAGDVLVVGAANSGAEVALDLAGDGRRVWLSGRHPGHVPFDIDGWFGRKIGVRFVGFLFHDVLKRTNPLGRAVISKTYGKGMPLVRTKPKDLAAAGVETVARIDEVSQGMAVTADGDVISPDVIVWACGYDPGFDWIDIDVLDADGYPRHRHGIVETQPGLYFVGLPFLFSVSSHTIHGVGRDAARIAEAISARRVAVPR